MQKLPLAFLVIGSIVGVLALLFGFQLFPTLLKKKISEQGRLINGTDRFENWRVVPIPVYQQVYIFNVTNPEEVKTGGKPILQELGPYVYQQTRTKVDIRVNENDTIFYKHHDVYHFREDMSEGKLTDQITVLNLPYLGTVAKALKMGSISRYFVSEMMSSSYPEEDLYVHITVDEFLFGGYYVNFMQELSELKGEVLLPNNTFGLYYNKNGSKSLEYEIYSGVEDPSKFGLVASYDGKTDVNLWNDEYCNQINGSDGTMFVPFLTPERDFYLFVPTLCRNMKFAFESETSFQDIKGYKYTVPTEYLESAKTNPDTRCYCENPGENYENCPKDGVWQLSACRQGTPLVMSFPHFYKGSEEYLNQFVGLSPKKEVHEMLVVLEPTTAISLKVQIRVQMNMDIKPTKHFPKLKKLQEMLHPIMWMDQGAEINEEKADLLKNKLFRTQEIVMFGTYSVFGFGCFLIVVAIAIYVCRSGGESKKYNPRKASLSQTNSFETGDTFLDPPQKSDWTKVSPNERYSAIAQTPPSSIRLPAEQQPFLSTSANEFGNSKNKYDNPPTVNIMSPTSPSGARTSSPPIVVAVYPKLSQEQPENSPFQQKSADEIDSVATRRMNSMDPPFPQTNEFSSTNSMNLAVEEMNNTLNDIQDTLSSYENL